jgi:predicted RNase H-like HicB family nuclease
VAQAVEVGVTSQGSTVDDAKKNLKEALELFLEDTVVTTTEIEYAEDGIR